MDDFPEFETYADVIDAYERDSMGYETLTDYIKGNNIKIKEIDISPLSDLENLRNGGSVGIEVLFKPKVPAAPSQLVSESDILLGYRGDAAAKSSGAKSQGRVGGSDVGESSTRSDPRDDGPDRSKVTQEQNINQLKNQLGIKDPNLIQKTFDTYNQLPLPVKGAINTMAPVELMKLFNIGNAINTGVNQMKYPDITEEDVTLGIDNLRADLTKAQKKALGKQKMGYDMGLFTIDDVRENIKPLGDPDKPATNEEIKEFFQAKDGGRVGFFMGGPALEGQALAIYNSMNAYGFSDQEIANALQEQGYYTPGGSTPDPTPPQTSQRLGLQGDEQDVGYVDRQDYSFNKKNYEPGKQLEINPAAFGISFEKASKPQGIINQALKTPGRTLTSFASPTTGGNITGPAEEGFMSQVVDIDPAGRTREELRQQYDSYNRFFGSPSNYAAARTPGKFGQVLGTIAGAAAGVPLLGAGIDALGKMTNRDKSDRSLYAVDNVGFGQGTQRDEFGVFTGGKTLFGDTTSYGERMAERLGELDDFFGSRIEGFDINNLTPDMLSQMSKINSFYTKQIQAYQQRLQRDQINKAQQDREKAQEIAKQKEEAAFQAQLNETQRQQRMQDLQRIERAYREDTGPGPGSYGPGGDSGIQRDSSGAEVGYNDPFDPGGGEKDGGFIDGYNRRKYSDGGLATMFRNKR